MVDRDEVEVGFPARRWIDGAGLAILAALSSFSIGLGIAFATGLIEPADRRPEGGRGAGFAMLAVGLGLLVPTSLALFGRRARRTPLVRAYLEGVVIREIGPTALDRIPLIPGLVRATWAFASGQGFRVRTTLIPWGSIVRFEAAGPPLMRHVAIRVAGPEPGGEAAYTVGQVEFRAPVDEVAAELAHLLADRRRRARLPRLRESEP